MLSKIETWYKGQSPKITSFLPRTSPLISKNNSTYENAVSQTLYGSWTLRVMGSWLGLKHEWNLALMWWRGKGAGGGGGVGG